MSEIKRYYVKQVREDEGGYVLVDVAEHPQGEWVRWEDVQELLDAQAEELRLLQERVNRLVESYRDPNK